MVNESVGELVFIVMEGSVSRLVATESNLGIVAFGDDINELKQQIRERVLEYFRGSYGGRIRLRQFHDIVFTCA